MSARGNDPFLNEPEWALTRDFAAAAGAGADFSGINMVSVSQTSQTGAWIVTLGTNGVNVNGCDVNVIVHGTTPLTWNIIHTTDTTKTISFLSTAGTAVLPGSLATVVFRRVPTL